MQISRLMQLHQTRLSNSLEAARAATEHPAIKGGATENEWIRLFREYLPARYAVGTGFVIDCNDQLSEQLDVLIFDRHFTPVLYSQEPLLYVPSGKRLRRAFEVKQSLDKAAVEYASEKAKSLRRLRRAATAVPTLHGRTSTGQQNPVLTGILTHRCEWADGLGERFTAAVRSTSQNPAGRLDLGCYHCSKQQVDNPLTCQ